RWLATEEKREYAKEKTLLATELMYAKTMSEEEALEWREETLTNGAKPKAAPAVEERPAARPAVKKAAPVAKKAAPAKAKTVATRAAAKVATARKTATRR